MLSMPSSPVAILAGAGTLPVVLADRLQSQGRTSRIIAFRGFADTDIKRRADRVMDLLDVKGIMACLQEWRPEAVVLAGAVRRPKASALLGSYSLFYNMQELKHIVARGDDNLLRGAITLLEENGFRVIGAHEIVPEIMSAEGIFGAKQPEEADFRSIHLGLSVLNSLSHYDIGQGVVVSGQRVLAIEGPEGTDQMLHRVASLQEKRLFSNTSSPSQGGALVKTAKIQQDLRIDMPVIGPKTVREAAKASLSGIAIGAGRTLVLKYEETIREADRLNIYLLGIRSE